MSLLNVSGRVNWKLVGIVVTVFVVLGAGATAGHYVRKRAVAARALQEGQAAYQRQDWPAAARYLWQYLQKYSDNPEVLAQYAYAQSKVRPLDGDAVHGIIAAYRRLVRLEPDHEEAYDQLAKLYAGIRDTDNLAYIARQRLARMPDDLKASVWLARSMALRHKPEQVREILLPIIDKWSNQPRRYPEYIDACSLLSEIAAQPDSPEAIQEAQRWLDRAVDYDPAAPEALINRARFRRNLAARPQQDQAALLASVREDLERAAALEPADPRQRLIISEEWMRLGDLDRATAQLDAARAANSETIAEYFFDPADWQIALYLQSSELALRRGNIDDAVRQSDRILADLDDKGRRLPALPAAVRAYVAAGRTADAERCLREYQENRHLDPTGSGSEDTQGLLAALVSRAQNRPYQVVELLEPIAARNPSNPAVWRLLAEAYTQTDQARRSIRTIRQYLAHHPDDLEMTRMLMRNYVHQQDWGRAVAAARQLESLEPGDVEAALLRIEDGINRAGAEASDDRAARLGSLARELDELVQRHPGQVDIRLLRAAVATQAGDMDRAEQELQQAREHGLDPQMLALQKARLYVAVREPDKAIAILQEACSQSPQTQPTQAAAWACLELADLQRTRGQVQEARQTLKTALKTLAGSAAQRDVLLKLAVLEIVQGDHAAGIDILRSLAAQDPRNIRIRTMLLAVPDVQQRADEAERLIREIQQVEGPRGLTWRLWQASVWLAAPDWRTRQSEIEANLQRCIDADPGWTTPALLLGRVQEQVGNADRAEAIYRNVLAADPAALEVADRLLSLLQRQGRLSQAGDVLKGLDATEASLGSRRTLIAMEAGQIDQAIDELKVRTTHDPRDVQSRVLLAQLVYRQTRDAQQALHYLDEADAISPGSIAVTMGRVIILNSEGRRLEAVEQLDALVRIKDSFEAHQLRASYLASIGQLDQAEKAYIHLSERPGDGTGHQVLGAFYAQTQRLDRAIATWREGIAAHADNLALQRSLMRGLLQQGNPDGVAEAERILSDLEVRLPKDPELMTLRASLLMARGGDEGTARAEKLLGTAVQIAPTYIDAHLGLISLALQRHDYMTARNRSVFALGINASDLRLLVLRAQTELALENLVMAHDLAALVLKDQPHNPQALHVLVQAALGTGSQRDLQNALDAVEVEQKRTPDDLVLRLTSALLLGRLGRQDEALASLEEYVATPAGRQSPEVIVALADLHQSRGDRARADELLRQAEQLQSMHPAVLRGRVNWYAAGQEYDRVVRLMAGYATSPAADAGVLEAAGIALSVAPDTAHREKALEFFQAAIQIASDPMPARIQYASLAYQLGHVDAAEMMYQRILQADPNNVQALNDLAWLLGKDRGRSEEALDMANHAAHLAPDNIHVRDTRGTILATLPGRLTDARREFETCVDLAPPDSPERARALLQLGRVYSKLEDPDQVRQRLEEARRIDSQRNVFSPTERSEIDQLTQASVLGGGVRLRR